LEVGFSLGSNIGEKAEMIRRAVYMLQDTGAITGITISSLYRTAPWGHVVEQDWFVNACGFGYTKLPPVELLRRCKDIETRLGRSETVRWGPRVIDIDLLYYGDLELDTPSLTIPHREILNRAFVLIPLAEIRPDRKIGDLSVAEAAAAIDGDGIERIEAGG
jgi:2-amino-4-hydroxy-6-hydroxymethyldihydropteridine diphosphokinase